MRLWLDDILPAPEGYDAVCKTAEEAQDVLRGRFVTHISFDMDLGVKIPEVPFIKHLSQEACILNNITEAVAYNRAPVNGKELAEWLANEVHFGRIPLPTYDTHTASRLVKSPR